LMNTYAGPWDVLVLSWTKIHFIRSTKSGNYDKSTTRGSTSTLQSIHLSWLPVPPWIKTNASDTSRNISHWIWRTTRRPSWRSEGSISSRDHQLWDVVEPQDHNHTHMLCVLDMQIWKLPGYHSENETHRQASLNTIGTTTPHTARLGWRANGVPIIIGRNTSTDAKYDIGTARPQLPC
jgi:hypothetical protein